MRHEKIAQMKDRVIPKWTFPLPAGTRLISSDDHALEPAHLWKERLPAADRDRVKFWLDETGPHMTVDGVSYDVPGIPWDYSEGREGFWDLDKRLADMDAEGIEKSIAFHGRTAGLIRMEDKALWRRCIDVYNDWCAELQKKSGGRLLPVAHLPTFLQPEATKDYIQRLKGLGLKAMQIPLSPRGVRYNSKEMEPMWAAIEESGMPLSIHIGAYLHFTGHGSLGANLNNNLQPFNGLFGLLVFSGIFDRHPDLKVVFTEGGAGWVAATLMGADKVYRDYGDVLKPQIRHKPSYYWHRNCWATFMDDPVALKMLDEIGADRIMWSVDYPHAEGVMGESEFIVRDIFEKAGTENGRKIVGQTAAALWGI